MNNNIKDLIQKISELESKVKELENFKAQAPIPTVNPDDSLYFAEHGKYSNNGFIRYHVSGKLHREDGPAREYPNGDEEWYQNGKRHRLDGPAVTMIDGNDIIYHWFISGEMIGDSEQGYTQEKFIQYVKLLAFK